MKDVTEKYIECPSCGIAMPNGEVSFENDYVFHFFKRDEIKLIYADFQCPKCFKVWRKTGDD